MAAYCGREKEMPVTEMLDLEFDLYDESAVGTEDEPIVWFDIETKKIEAPKTFPYRLRWQPFMICVAGAMDPGVFFVNVFASDDEKSFIEYADMLLNGTEARYSATREFDEMILRGRFTNARRAHLDRPGRWPNLDRADIVWKNIRKELSPVLSRPKDIPSKDVPAIWKEGEHGKVVTHCKRDVLQLVLRDTTISLDRKLRKDLLAEYRKGM